jgi:hypothetical protein
MSWNRKFCEWHSLADFGDRFKMKNAKVIFPMEKMTFAFRNRMSLPGFEPGAFRLGVGAEAINPRQK